MFLEPPTWSEQGELTSDVAIIGAGAAGISLALELSRQNISVLLIEGGEWDYSQSSQDLYSGESSGVPLPYGLQGSRFRFMGGSTNCWGGGCGELDAEDFSKRDWVPLSGWPIAKQDLSAYYTKAARFLSINEPVSHPGVVSHGLDTLSGFEFRHLTHTTTVRFRTEFKQQLSSLKNIRVMLDANCNEIRFSSVENSVSKLYIKALSGEKAIVKAKHYILACGGIENARLLLNAYEQKSAPCPFNSNTGRYFSDHPIAPCATIFVDSDAFDTGNIDVQNIVANSSRNDLKVPYYRLPAEVQRQERVLNAVIQLSTQERELSPEVAALWRLRNFFQGNSEEVQFSDLKTVASRPVKLLRWLVDNKSDGKRFAMRFQIEQAPNPNSYVALSDELDALGLRKTRLNWQFSSLERRTVDVLLRYAAKQFLKMELGVLKIDLSLRANKIELPPDLRGGQHHSGTTRMSTSAKTGVVDSDLRVFGIDNLYVVGSSVFPTNGWVNPTFTIIALAFRLADHLTGKLCQTGKAP